MSLPNVANLYVRLNHLLGRFPLHSKGLLDRTHLHHYTLTTAHQLLMRTGWVVEERAVTAIPLAIVFPFLEKIPFNLFLALFRGMTRGVKGLLAYQGIFYCKNPNKPHLL